MNAKKFLAMKPTKLATVMGKGVYECPVYGDENEPVVVVDGVAYWAGCFDIPGFYEMEYLLKDIAAGNATPYDEEFND